MLWPAVEPSRKGSTAGLRAPRRTRPQAPAGRASIVHVRNISSHEYQRPRPSIGPVPGLTDYGDRQFAKYLRRTFAHSTGRSRTRWHRRGANPPSPRLPSPPWRSPPPASRSSGSWPRSGGARPGAWCTCCCGERRRRAGGARDRSLGDRAERETPKGSGPARRPRQDRSGGALHTVGPGPSSFHVKQPSGWTVRGPATSAGPRVGGPRRGRRVRGHDVARRSDPTGGTARQLRPAGDRT